jgi:hypothetical protein
VHICFSNTGVSTFHRVSVSLSTLPKLGPVETHFTGYAIDDFALDEEMEEVYLAGGERNALMKVGFDGGEVHTLYGGSETGLVAPASAALGRSWGEKVETFVTTQKGGVVSVDVWC